MFRERRTFCFQDNTKKEDMPWKRRTSGLPDKDSRHMHTLSFYMPQTWALIRCAVFLLSIGLAVMPGVVPAMVVESTHGHGIPWHLSFWAWLLHSALARRNEAGESAVKSTKDYCQLDPAKLGQSLISLPVLLLCLITTVIWVTVLGLCLAGCSQ